MQWIHRADIQKFIHQYDETNLEETIKGTIGLMEKYSFIPKCFVARMKRVKTEEGFDKVLESLYNYADANRIWLGF